MAKEQIKKIREAVCANRGGLEEATDEQIMIIWGSLDSATQKQYLESIPAPAPKGKGKEAKDAVST